MFYGALRIQIIQTHEIDEQVKYEVSLILQDWMTCVCVFAFGTLVQHHRVDSSLSIFDVLNRQKRQIDVQWLAIIVGMFAFL